LTAKDDIYLVRKRDPLQKMVMNLQIISRGIDTLPVMIREK